MAKGNSKKAAQTGTVKYAGTGSATSPTKGAKKIAGAGSAGSTKK